MNQRADPKLQKIAYTALKNAFTSGVLARKPCEVCGAIPSHAHYPDYSRPLLVQWLCQLHHNREHARRRSWVVLTEMYSVQSAKGWMHRGFIPRLKRPIGPSPRKKFVLGRVNLLPLYRRLGIACGQPFPWYKPSGIPIYFSGVLNKKSARI
jgi:hypothetical protein